MIDRAAGRSSAASVGGEALPRPSASPQPMDWQAPDPPPESTAQLWPPSLGVGVHPICRMVRSDTMGTEGIEATAGRLMRIHLNP